MKCPNCGGQMGLEDEVCPYCHTPNAQAAQHQSDMARYRQEFQRTQDDVLQRTSLMQRHGSWLVILVVLLVALMGGVALNAYAWDIGYSIREGNVARAADEDTRAMDELLARGDYGMFVGYYDANDVDLDYESPYQATYWAAYSYTDLLSYVSALGDGTSLMFGPERISDTCGYVAEDLNRIFTLERRYTYDAERYFSAEQRAYIDDIRERAALVAQAYFGLSEGDVDEIPNMSTAKLASLIEEGIAR